MSRISPAPIPNDAVAELCHLSRQMLKVHTEIPDLRESVTGLMDKLDAVLLAVMEQTTELKVLNAHLPALIEKMSEVGEKAVEVRDALVVNQVSLP